MSAILKSIIEAIAGSFFSEIAEMFKDSFARRDQIALGTETEKAKQAAVAIEAKEAMTQEQLRPRPSSEVKGRLKKGTF